MKFSCAVSQYPEFYPDMHTFPCAKASLLINLLLHLQYPDIFLVIGSSQSTSSSSVINLDLICGHITRENLCSVFGTGNCRFQSLASHLPP